ncbi:MAG: rhodanese-like domain-containing protein [Desulfobulbaceae bacterium]|uniref:Rhodanese-like domain-containing protein n=1 Tax=Candidatus Desulfobia pelagia TaxID=2841692 RepID=A0A8J6NAL5_9BACT|nr:rhodanese-like domain-containing protein [Candidatus Desulfobia pelagia]
MRPRNIKLSGYFLFTLLFTLTCMAGSVYANEVEKGQIPGEHLSKSLKKLPWGAPIWDAQEAINQLNSDEKVLWIDTRPESFFTTGTVRNAILLPFNKTGKQGNDMTEETLAAAISDAGLDKNNAKIVLFCQGPKCHRSYNASFKAITEWGYSADNIVWFRAGYPHLITEIQNNPKLKRKAKKYICDNGMKQL